MLDVRLARINLKRRGKPLSDRPACVGRDLVMLLHLLERPWDLVAALGYTLVMTAGVLVAREGSMLAILLVLFFPGYLLVAALFPEDTTIDWIERTALSFGLSVAVVPLLGLLLYFTPFGMKVEPMITTIAAFTVVAGFTAYWRRMRLPPDRRLSLTLCLEVRRW